MNIKQELIAKISDTSDKKLLLLMKGDFDYFTHFNGTNITDDFSAAH